MMGFVMAVQVLCCSTVMAEESITTTDEVTEVAISANAKKLLALGLLDESQLLQGDKTVTKGEFCAIVVKLFALEQFMPVAKSTYFYDVPITHPYIQEISFLYEAGMINGTGNNHFGADEPITFNAALTILLRALGYENIAKREGGYPIGYYRVADQYGLLDKLKIGGNEQLLADDMYRLLANCAETLVCEVFPVGNGVEYTVEAGNTLLWARHKIVSKTGVVTANAYSTLARPRAKIVDCIGIDGKDYICPDESFYDLLGKSVKYYVQEIDDEETVVYAEEYKNDTLKIAAEDIVNASSSAITYLLENDEEEEYSVDAYTDVLYNGVALTGYGALNSIMPATGGYIELIDNDRDGVAEVILITEAKDIIIGSLNKDGYSVYDKLTNQNVDLGNDGGVRTYMKLSDGTVIRFGQLEVGDIVSVYASKNTSGIKVQNIVISKNFISGKISELIDNDIYVIDGTEYRKSASCTDALSVGTTGIFYLNHNGRIVSYLEQATADMKFGVVVAGTEYDAFKGELSIRLFTQDGEFVNFDCADRVSYTFGSASSSGKIEDSTFVSGLRAKLVTGEVIMYRENNDGKISAFSIVNEADSNPAKLNLMQKGNSFVHYSGYIDGTILIDNTTIIFSIPSDSTDEKDYRILTNSNISSSSTAKNFEYAAYYIGDTRLVPATAMKIEDYQSSSIADATGLAVVTETSIGIVDDEQASLIRVLFNNKETKLYLTDENKATIKSNRSYSDSDLNLKVGDIIKYGAESGGEITDIQIIYNGTQAGVLAPPSEEYADKLGGGTFQNVGRLVYGEVEEVNSNKIFSYNIPKSTGDVYEIRKVAGSPKIMKIITERGAVELGTFADINPGDVVIIRSQYGIPQEIVIIK